MLCIFLFPIVESTTLKFIFHSFFLHKSYKLAGLWQRNEKKITRPTFNSEKTLNYFFRILRYVSFSKNSFSSTHFQVNSGRKEQYALLM